MVRRLFVIGLSLFVTAGARAQTDLPFEVEAVTSFDEPWAWNLIIVTQDGEKSRSIRGMPDISYGGQGGLGDVALAWIPDHDTHPEFEQPAVWWSPVISPSDLMTYRR